MKGAGAIKVVELADIRQLQAAMGGALPEGQAAQRAAVELARRHGVLYPLQAAWRAADGAAAAVRRELDGAAVAQRRELDGLLRGQALAALRSAHALAGLLEAFAGRGLRIAPLKGPVLSLLLYGRIEWRPSVDLDLVIDPAQAAAAYRLLRGLGYAPLPVNCPRTPEEAAAIDIDWYFRHPETGLLLDVQASVIGPGYPQRLNALYNRSSALQVAFMGREVALPDPEILYLYLAFHAARHRGERLMWRQDLQALLDKFPGFDWPRCRALARGCGLEKFLDWAEAWRRSGTARGERWTGAAPERSLLNMDGLFHLLSLHSGPANKWRYAAHALFAPCHKDWLALPPGAPRWRVQLRRYPRLLGRVWERATGR